jgi:hypothetical protein
MNRRTLLVVVTVLLTGCGLVKTYPTYHYRLTVEVDTPQGVRSGSSVIEVKSSEVGTTLGGAGAEARGEAVAVDLPGGQTLFALLRSEAEVGWAAGAMSLVTPFPGSDGNPKHDFARSVTAIRANTKLNIVPRTVPGYYPPDPPRSGYPMLVRFGDVRDPKSVAKVDPDHLDASFGSGVTLRRITLQLTDDPMTNGIEKRLGWLGDYHRRNARLNGSTKIAISTNDLADNLGSGNFSTELKK